MRTINQFEMVGILGIDMTATVVCTEDMMTAPVDNEIIILNLKGNNYISLDPVGRRIWELLEPPVTVAYL